MLALLVPCPDHGLEALEQRTALQVRSVVFTNLQLNLTIGRLYGGCALVRFRNVHERFDFALACHIEHKIVLFGSVHFVRQLLVAVEMFVLDRDHSFSRPVQHGFG